MTDGHRVDLEQRGYDDDSHPATKGDMRALHRRMDRFETNIERAMFGEDKMSGLVGEINKLKFQARLVKWFAALITILGITALSSTAARWVDKVNNVLP